MSRNLYNLYCIANTGLQISSKALSLLKQDICVLINKTQDTSLYDTMRYHSVKAKIRQPVAKTETKTKTKTTKGGVRHYSTNTFDNYKIDPELVNAKPSKPSKNPTIIGHDDGNLTKSVNDDLTKTHLNSSKVPSSRLSRIFHYGTLAAGMSLGMAQQGIKHYTGTSSDKTSPLTLKSLILNANNIERMARKFSQMRGAALKIGQLLSFQDNSILPPEIQQILLKVQNSAHYMPFSQLNSVMSSDLGNNWRANCFSTFNDVPIAAASIGQVHDAITKDLSKVVVKVQYPGVANSIDSDLNNILMLLTASSLLPAGLFLDQTIANARTELKWECDYIREAQNLIRFEQMVQDYPEYKVPKVYHKLCGKHVLTMEKLEGVEIIKGDWSQDVKNYIASSIMKLCLLEIKQFKFMQTDPNWANFLYNETTSQIELLDFGAARDFSDEFINNYIEILRASVRKDRIKIQEISQELGYLTGLESKKMIDAHVDSVIVLGEPFSGQGEFNFKNQTVTNRVRDNIGVMLKERLTPPPEETYSLHRKLSGVFLLCARLNAEIPCSQIFQDIIGNS